MNNNEQTTPLTGPVSGFGMFGPGPGLTRSSGYVPAEQANDNNDNNENTNDGP